MAILKSQLQLTLVDQVSGRLRGINAAISGFQNRTRNLMAPITGVTARMAALGAGYLGATAGISGTIGAARDMQAALTEIGIKSDLAGGQLAALQRNMTSLSPKVNQTTAELLAGVDTMVTLGLGAHEAAAAMPAIGKAATATMSSISDLSAATVAAQQNMGVTSGEVSRMLDAMTSAGNAGAFEVRDMAREFPALTAAAKSLGMEGVEGITDMAAALQIARRGAGDASTAANNMANFLQKIATPQTIKNFKKFGVDVTKELQKAHKKGISPIEHFIGLVDEKTKGGRADLLGQLFGDKQVLEFIRPMLADFKDYIRIREEAERASGTVADAYAKRMGDAEQKLKSFRIQIQNLGTSLGGRLLNPIGDFAGRLAYLLDSSGQRVSVFDQIQARFDSFASGLGQGSGAQMLKSIGTWLEKGIFGDASTFEKDVNQLSASAGKFREFGTSLRETWAAWEQSPLGEITKTVGGWGFKLAAASVGFALLAGSIRKLASALFFLTGAKAAVSILKGIKDLGGALIWGDGAKPGKPGTPAKTPTPATTPTAGVIGLMGLLGKISAVLTPLLIAGDRPDNAYTNATPEERERMRREADDATYRHNLDKEVEGNGRGARRQGADARIPWARDNAGNTEPVLHPEVIPKAPTGIFQKFLDGMNGLAPQQRDPIPTLEGIRAAVSAPPSGVQQVQVTNPPQIHAPINVTVHAVTNASPDAIGDAVGGKIKSAIEGSYLDAM